MKKQFILMIVIALVLVGSLTFIGFKLQSKNKGYYELEEKLLDAAKIYFGQYPGRLPNGSTTISSEQLIQENMLDNLNYEEEICKGYVLVKKNGLFYDYKPFIKCSNYLSKKYNPNNE